MVGACEPNALSSDHKKSYLYNLEGLSSRIFVSTLQFFLLRFHGYLFAYQVYDWIFFFFLLVSMMQGSIFAFVVHGPALFNASWYRDYVTFHGSILMMLHF